MISGEPQLRFPRNFPSLLHVPADMKRLLLLTPLLLAAVLLPAQLPSQTLPKLKGKALSGAEVILPDAARGRVTLILFGFSKASGKPCKEWAAHVWPMIRKDAQTNLFTVAEMQGIPGFIKGMVVGSIRRDTPEGYRSHFLPIFQDRIQWQQIASYQKSAPDDAYLVLIDPQGTIRWRAHGPYTPALFTELQQQIAKWKPTGKR